MIQYNQASRVEVQYNNLAEYADTYDYKHKYSHCDINFQYIYKYMKNGKKKRPIGKNGMDFNGLDKPLHENDAYAAYLLKR